MCRSAAPGTRFSDGFGEYGNRGFCTCGPKSTGRHPGRPLQILLKFLTLFTNRPPTGVNAKPLRDIPVGNGYGRSAGCTDDGHHVGRIGKMVRIRRKNFGRFGLCGGTAIAVPYIGIAKVSDVTDCYRLLFDTHKRPRPLGRGLLYNINYFCTQLPVARQLR